MNQQVAGKRTVQVRIALHEHVQGFTLRIQTQVTQLYSNMRRRDHQPWKGKENCMWLQTDEYHDFLYKTGIKRYGTADRGLNRQGSELFRGM